MSCDICEHSNCVASFHSLAEQERYEKVIAAFDRARELRESVRQAVTADKGTLVERLRDEADL